MPFVRTALLIAVLLLSWMALRVEGSAQVAPHQTTAQPVP